MARLRVRIELNRGGVGVPMHKLASVAQESERFFQMLAEDVHIERERGEWLAFDFDHESLNFTAEYVGPVSAEQVRAFCAAFDGVTSLRRTTIAQFTRIADAIGEDELIGFGLYPSSHEFEPSEWRCLSRRDALRIADEIQLLQGAAGELDQDTYLPSVNTSTGAYLFKERHERNSPAVDQSKWPNFVREVESNLAKRIGRLEGEVENHSNLIGDLREASATVEESVRSLLTTVETFCGQATRQIQRHSPQLPPSSRPASSRRNWRAILVALIVIIGIASLSLLIWPSRPREHADQAVNARPAVEPSKQDVTDSSVRPQVASSKPQTTTASAVRPVELTKPKVTVAVVPGPTVLPEPSSEVMHVDLEAREPAWVSITDVDGRHVYVGVMQANETRSIDLTKGATLRTGNAGGLIVRFNGKEIGAIGPAGKIRDVQFQNGSFKIL